MASIRNDFGISGKLGNIVFYKIGDKTFARIQGVVNNPKTEKQQTVRSRFLLAIRFYQKLKETKMKDVLAISARGVSSNGYTFFMQKNLKVFRTDGSIGDFSQLQLSRGIRQRGYLLKGRIDEEGDVLLRWKNNSKTEDDDRLMVVVLHADRSFSPVVYECAGLRRDGMASFRVEAWKGEVLHLYCFFVAPGGELVSTSQYVCLRSKI